MILTFVGLVVLALGVVGASYAAKSSPKAATFKVGLVTDIGGLNDRGFNHLSYVGLLKAEKVLHIQGGRLHPEPLVSGEGGLQPRHRRRLPPGAGDPEDGEAVPEDEVRGR
jgi:hypothetical protein